MRLRVKCQHVIKSADGSETAALTPTLTGNEQWAGPGLPPTASINLRVVERSAQGQLVPGQDYWLDVTPVT